LCKVYFRGFRSTEAAFELFLGLAALTLSAIDSFSERFCWHSVAFCKLEAVQAWCRHGALAASGATFVGHYPWFVTRNYLEELLPTYDDLGPKLMRAAVIGFASSAVSDTCSNSIRVIKTTKQTHPDNLSYPQALQVLLCPSRPHLHHLILGWRPSEQV
jgi:hypothetical protein